MLVLTRKPDEKIFVGDEIVITVLETRNGRMKIGIDAPEGMKILRGEHANPHKPLKGSQQ